MRQKKSSYIWYALAGIIAAILVWAISQDVPIHAEHVEVEIENSFAG